MTIDEVLQQLHEASNNIEKLVKELETIELIGCLAGLCLLLNMDEPVGVIRGQRRMLRGCLYDYQLSIDMLRAHFLAAVPNIGMDEEIPALRG